MGINKKEYLQFIKEEKDFNILRLNHLNKRNNIDNKMIKIIIEYIKCLYPQIKYFHKDMIVGIEYFKNRIDFNIDSIFHCSISEVLGTTYAYFKMPIKYLDPKERQKLKLERKLELL